MDLNIVGGFMEKIDNLENWELYISIIKRINNRILRTNFALGKETETILFLKDMKARLLQIVMNSENVNFGITSSWDTNSSQKCGLLMEVMEINDEQELVFIAIDIDNGDICLKNDSGYPIQCTKVDGKILTSDFKIDNEYDMAFVLEHVEIPNIGSDEINYYRIFDYLRNNQKVFAEFLEMMQHTR